MLRLTNVKDSRLLQVPRLAATIRVPVAAVKNISTAAAHKNKVSCPFSFHVFDSITETPVIKVRYEGIRGSTHGEIKDINPASNAMRMETRFDSMRE